MFQTLATGTIDSSLVTELINIVKSLLGLFAEFPLNVFLIGSIGSIGFAWLKKAKKVAR